MSSLLTVRSSHREGRIDGFAAEISLHEGAPILDLCARNPLAIAKNARAATPENAREEVHDADNARPNATLRSQGGAGIRRITHTVPARDG
jgi:hypothetical protein